MVGELTRHDSPRLENPLRSGAAPEVCHLTDRLILRTLEQNDVPALVRGLSNWNVSRWLGRVPHPYTPCHARTWLEQAAQQRRAGRALTLGIVRRGGPDIVIGAVGSHNIEGCKQSCGYWLAEDHWGRGYLTEAMRGLLAALFVERHDAEPIATCLPDNAASIRVLEKSGFRRERRRSYIMNVAHNRKMQVVHFTFPDRADHPRPPVLDPTR